MRIALVSPYSWTYPGGVTRHIEALAGQFLAGGHDVRVLAPFDPDDRLSARMHAGARPESRPVPEYMVPLGRTIGLPTNGAVSNVALTANPYMRARHELEQGDFDVVHVHEPVTPIIAWDAVRHHRGPLVGTYHCYSENLVTNGIASLLGTRRAMSRLHVRIAVSEAAAWTGRRFFGGTYRVIPNGVDLHGGVGLCATANPLRRPDDPLRIVFVGQAVERKGLPVLLRAFEALREHIPATLEVVGATEEEVAPLLLDGAHGVTVLGKVDDEAKHAALQRADVLSAPSLGGESFGMVLTEAFAAGTPVVASDIAGYRDVVRNGVDGILHQRGNATELAEALQELYYEPERRLQMARAARERAERFAWPRVAEEVLQAYEDARAMPAIEGGLRGFGARHGFVPADGKRVAPQRLPRLETDPTATKPAVAAARKIGLVVLAVLGVGLAAMALERIGVHRIVLSLLQSSPVWVVVGLGVMCASMVLRAVSWHAILRAAMPGVRVRLRDAAQGTFVGVLMSATLPARLGEPSRAFIVARRTGRVRERFPVVLGTLVSQTLLNIVALVVLGTVMFATVGLFSGREQQLLWWMAAPLVLVLLVVLAPALVRPGTDSRSSRVKGWMAQARAALVQVRRGLRVFHEPRQGALATAAQLGAWTLQWLSCYILLVALGLDARAGMGAAAAVLFAVNVTAVLPATPSNLGIFQAACVAVLTGAYGVSAADALGYGIILQAVEIATALLMGMPALVREGLSWRDVRIRALHTAPVELTPRRAAG
ncbi:MAG: lysylphosphatidylglycerol synthase domain-containing protein [Solirubrobacteraceae bacterium]